MREELQISDDTPIAKIRFSETMGFGLVELQGEAHMAMRFEDESWLVMRICDIELIFEAYAKQCMPEDVDVGYN